MVVSLKDVENKILIPTSSQRFEYLLAICKVEQQALLPEKYDDDDDDDTDQYYLRDGIANVVDEHPSTCKNDEPKPVFKVAIAEEDKEGICLKKLRRLRKVSTKSRSAAAPDGGETAAMGLNPSPNPKRKRRSRNEGAAAAEKKRKRGGGENQEPNSPPPPAGLPETIKNAILRLAETREVSAKLVIEKKLTRTDMSGTHNRLSIPTKRLRESFLTEEEEVQLRTRNGKNVGSKDVLFITPAREMTRVSLRRWVMNKRSGPPSISYVLSSSWNRIKEENKLRSGMNVQLWALRVDGALCLALTCK